jgi:uncharacterized surface protein with fasciclin (FAS1) repeats
MRTRSRQPVKFWSSGLFVLLFGLTFALGLIPACKKSTPAAPVPLTPLQKKINADSTLSSYHRLLIESNQLGLLNDDTVTLLIPDNTAFRAAGFTADSIDKFGATQAGNIVRYGLIPGRVIIPLADSGAYLPYTTLLGFSIYGMSDGTHVWFNGVQAVFDTAGTGQAVVYRLSALLGNPPADSLGLLLGGDTSLSFLAEALLRTGLDSVLATGNYTLLAPDNNAFINAGYDSLGAIDSADLTSLTQLMEYQVVKGVYFTNTLAGQTSLSTLQGGTVSVTFQNSLFQFSGPGNPVPANLLPGSRLAGSTLLVYRIDEVLMP